MGTKEEPSFVTKIFLLNTSIIVLLFLLLAVPPLVYSGYRLDSPGVTLTQETNSGSTGQVVVKESIVKTNEVYILNETPSPDSNSWRYDWFPYWPSLSRAETMMNEQGLVLDLKSIEYWLWNDVNIPLDDYDSLEFFARISLLSGKATVEFEVDYNDLYGVSLDHLEQIQNANLTSENDSVQLSFNAPLSTINSLSSHWLVHAYVRVAISTKSSAKVLLHNVSAKATSSQELFPLRIDVQSTNGSSLYDNPYFKWLRDSPRLNLTRQGTPDEWAIIYPARPNDTLYLTPSNFTGYGGWRSTIRHPDQCVQVAISLSYGDDTYWGIRLSSTRLYVSVSPHLPAIDLSMQDNDYNPYFLFPFDSEVTNFIYIPLEMDDKWFHIEVSSDSLFLFELRWISRNARWDGPMVSTHDYYLDIEFPVANLGSLALTLSDIIVLILFILCGMLVIVRIVIHYRKLGLSLVLKDPRLIPVILLFVSASLPWVVYTQSIMSWSGPETTANFSRINPLATYFEFNNDSLIIIHPGMAVVGYSLNAVWLVVGAVFLFWLPLLYCSTSVGVSEEKRYDLHFAIMLMLPIGLALSSFIPGLYISTLTLGLGSYLAILALPLWLIAEVLYRNRLNVTDLTEGV